MFTCTKSKVKMAGYWPSYFLLRASTPSRSIKHAKKERGEYLAILIEQCLSITFQGINKEHRKK